MSSASAPTATTITATTTTAITTMTTGTAATARTRPEAGPVSGRIIFDYLRDPDAIYRASFLAVRGEANLGRLPETARPLAERLVHACGMADILDDLRLSDDAVAAGRSALAASAPVLVDAAMVAAGITRLEAGNEVFCAVGEAAAAEGAKRDRTTRSAAAVDLWRPRLGGAVVAIGNAPTALFRLLEVLLDGAPAPALIVGMPVGFIGAAESKQALIEHAGAVPYVTVVGRRGGSALAAAAVNALAMAS
jgi:precorrin-8X/cobalt-precorrin-8 methylmutase